jgi:hypothetical protein
MSLPPVPRPLTSAASRRSWNERPVRVWVILFLTVAAITAYFVAERVVKVRAERELIVNGRNVLARVAVIEESTREDRVFSRERDLPVTLAIPRADGQGEELVEGRLAGGIEGNIRIGEKIEVRVDPNDPRRWTDRLTPKPWMAELTILYGLAPLVVLLGGLVLLARLRVLSVWKNGQETLGTVIDAKQSSIAPMSKVVRFVLDGQDKRVYSVLCPAGEVPDPGDPIELLAPANNPNRAIVARLYASPT